MFKGYMKIIIMLTMLSLCGCSLMTIKKPSTAISEEKLSKFIGQKGKGSESIYLSIGEAYAMKSIYSARRHHPYSKTIVIGSIGTEIFSQTSEPGAWFAGLGFYLFTPFVFLYDTIMYPFNLYDHITIDDESIDIALEELELARKNGYHEKYNHFVPYSVPVLHLDQ